MCVLDFGGSWKKYLPLVEFVYNNNYHSSIRMALYEALYGGNAGLLCARKKLVRELWQVLSWWKSLIRQCL